MSLVNKFAEFVKQIRLEKEMSQEELSKMIFDRPNRQYISALENGKVENITIATMQKLMDALGFELDFHFFEKSDLDPDTDFNLDSYFDV